MELREQCRTDGYDDKYAADDLTPWVDSSAHIVEQAAVMG